MEERKIQVYFQSLGVFHKLAGNPAYIMGHLKNHCQGSILKKCKRCGEKNEKIENGYYIDRLDHLALLEHIKIEEPIYIHSVN